ncbi:MAG: hypothetical protein H7Y17_13660 [Chlorobia bacterium]|nr:hypothetical protein [Fimbriimonadaceae bacterium]
MLLMVFTASLGPARAEFVRESSLSPDKTKELRIERTSEAPDLTAKLLHKGKEIWSQKLSSIPGDKVTICWCPDSSATVVEHINEQKQCRLLVVEVGEQHVRTSAVSAAELRDVLSVNPAKVVWEKDGSITLDLETKAGPARRRIAWSCHLLPIESRK